jgi:hypothetical protein
MNDEFLTQFQVPPREAFAEELKARLSTIKSKKPSQTLRWVSLGFVAICVVIAAVLVVSPAARAQVSQMIYNIAGYRVGVVSDVVNPQAIAVPKTTEADLKTAERVLGQAVKLPSYLPLGFGGEPKVTTTSGLGPMGLNILWTHKDVSLKDDQKYLSLSIVRGLRNTQMNIVNAQPVTVEVDGLPALLAQSVWSLEVDANGKVTGKLLQTNINMLIWKVGELDYSIAAGNNVSVEDLIRMAESVK